MLSPSSVAHHAVVDVLVQSSWRCLFSCSSYALPFLLPSSSSTCRYSRHRGRYTHQSVSRNMRTLTRVDCCTHTSLHQIHTHTQTGKQSAAAAAACAGAGGHLQWMLHNINIKTKKIKKGAVFYRSSDEKTFDSLSLSLPCIHLFSPIILYWPIASHAFLPVCFCLPSVDASTQSISQMYAVVRQLFFFIFQSHSGTKVSCCF